MLGSCATRLGRLTRNRCTRYFAHTGRPVTHLRRSGTEIWFETLSLPEVAVGTALASFERGESPKGLSSDQFIRAVDPPAAESHQQRLDRQFYNRLGPEDLSRPCKRGGSARGATSNSVLCRHHHFEMVMRRECPFDE